MSEQLSLTEVSSFLAYLATRARRDDPCSLGEQQLPQAQKNGLDLHAVDPGGVYAMSEFRGNPVGSLGCLSNSANPGAPLRSELAPWRNKPQMGISARLILSSASRCPIKGWRLETPRLLGPRGLQWFLVWEKARVASGQYYYSLEVCHHNVLDGQQTLPRPESERCRMSLCNALMKTLCLLWYTVIRVQPGVDERVQRDGLDIQ
jgi:hypothetical protein